MPERLWAPWRLEYIESADKATGCIFCTKPAENCDEEHLILCRSAHSYILLNKFPYSNGHLMVAPFKHSADMNDLDDAEMLDIQQMVRMSVNVLKGVYNPDGFNLGVNLGRVAGAGVEGHIHWHVVPRWSGDTNFMPVISDIRVIPDSLEATYKRLKEQYEVICGR